MRGEGKFNVYSSILIRVIIQSKFARNFWTSYFFNVDFIYIYIIMYTISILALLLTRLSNRLFHRSSPEWIQYASIRSLLTWESRIDRPFFPFRENEDWQGPRVGRHESFYPHVEPSDAASFLRKGTLSMTGGGQLANWRAPINRGQLRCVEDDRARLTVLRIVGVAYRLPFSRRSANRGCARLSCVPHRRISIWELTTGHLSIAGWRAC